MIDEDVTRIRMGCASDADEALRTLGNRIEEMLAAEPTLSVPRFVLPSTPTPRPRIAAAGADAPDAPSDGLYASLVALAISVSLLGAGLTMMWMR